MYQSLLSFATSEELRAVLQAARTLTASEQWVWVGIAATVLTQLIGTGIATYWGGRVAWKALKLGGRLLAGLGARLRQQPTPYGRALLRVVLNAPDSRYSSVDQSVKAGDVELRVNAYGSLFCAFVGTVNVLDELNGTDRRLLARAFHTKYQQYLEEIQREARTARLLALNRLASDGEEVVV